jgi:hypothetical protein
MGCIMTAARSDKRQTWLPTYHFEKLLKEAYPNHAYPIKHKLEDCDVMKKFIISGSLTWGMELNEVPQAGLRRAPHTREAP